MPRKLKSPVGERLTALLMLPGKEVSTVVSADIAGVGITTYCSLYPVLGALSWHIWSLPHHYIYILLRALSCLSWPLPPVFFLCSNLGVGAVG